MTKSEKVPILGIFFSKDHFNVKGRVKKIRVGRPTGTTHIFHLSLSVEANIVNPDQTVPTGSVRTWSTLFVYEASNISVDDKNIHFVIMRF